MATTAEELVRDGLMGISDAASFLELGRSQVYDLMQTGELDHDADEILFDAMRPTIITSIKRPLTGAAVTLTPDLIAARRDCRWDSPRAERLLRETLDRRCEPEARIEAAILTGDMVGFVRALVAYEHFALQTFVAWARPEARDA